MLRATNGKRAFNAVTIRWCSLVRISLLTLVYFGLLAFLGRAEAQQSRTPSTRANGKTQEQNTPASVAVRYVHAIADVKFDEAIALCAPAQATRASREAELRGIAFGWNNASGGLTRVRVHKVNQQGTQAKVVLALNFFMGDFGLIELNLAKLNGLWKVLPRENEAPAPPVAASPELPAQEVQLCNLIKEHDHWTPPPRDPNPIRAANTPPVQEPDWNAKLHALMGDGTFTDWKGTINFYVHHPPAVEVSFILPCASNGGLVTDVNTFTFGTEQIRVDTNLKLGSPLANVLSTMNHNGGSVMVSGVMLDWHGIYLPGHGFVPLDPKEWHTVFVARFDKIATQ